MNDWFVNLKTKEARHSSGLTIVFNGKPDSSHFSGSLAQYPRSLTPLELSRLIRQGYEKYCSAYTSAAAGIQTADAARARTPGFLSSMFASKRASRNAHV